jgi:pimeloyl-ACP methyl ester carboxylesterase
LTCTTRSKQVLTCLARPGPSLRCPAPFTRLVGAAEPGGTDTGSSRLERSGYTVIAPANPLRGPYNDSTYIASVLNSIQGPVVLVGHSYGGAVISSAAAVNPRVKSLVYVSALMPDVGESGMSLAARFPGELGTATRSVPYRERPQRDRPVPQARQGSPGLRRRPAGERGESAGATQRPAATTAFSEKAKVAAWKHIPSWALVGRQDKTINPDQERFQAKRAGSHTVEINSSHVSLIAHPAAVADLILQAAGAPSSARPSRAVTGSPNDVRAKAALAGFAGASLAAGAGAVLLGRRLRRTRR